MPADRFDFFAIWKDLPLLAPGAAGAGRPLLAPVLMVLFGAAFVVLLLWFFRRFRSGSRTYGDAGIMAGAVFSLMSFIEWDVLFVTGSSADAFIYFDMILLYQTVLPLTVFSLMLVVSNAVLLFREGFRLTNLLALGLGVMITVGIHVAFALNCLSAKWFGDLVIDVFASMFFLFFCSVFFGMAVTCFIYTHQHPSPDRKYVIVLGCRVMGDKVTPLLRGRIDTALRFCRYQTDKTGKTPVFILSGGKGSDENVSEAEAMRRCLTEQNVPAEDMVLEDRSVSTWENFINSKKIVDERSPGEKGVFATTDYHVFRSELLCRKAGLDAVGLAAPSKWYYLPNAFVREVIATFTSNRKPFLLSVVCMLFVTLGIALWQWLVIHPGQPLL